MMKERIRRVLGPSHPELTCDQCFAHLAYYVEFEVIPGRQFERCPTCVSPSECTKQQDCLGMRAHLEGCPACEEEHDILRALVKSETGDPSS